MLIDPVCGMEVDENKTAHQLRSEHHGPLFLFLLQRMQMHMSLYQGSRSSMKQLWVSGALN